jgi:hypothetical protein
MTVPVESLERERLDVAKLTRSGVSDDRRLRESPGTHRCAPKLAFDERDD